jgi:proliferating cell nuclear antigen
MAAFSKDNKKSACGDISPLRAVTKRSATMRLFELKTVQATAWRGLWECLKELLNDVTVNIDKNGVHLTAIDGSKVSLVHLRLDAFNFETFSCAEPVGLGLNCLSVYKLLKSVVATDCITWYVDEQQRDVLKMMVENGEKNCRTRYDLRLLALDEDQLQIPDFTSNVTIVNMPSSELQRIVRDMAALSPHMAIRMTDDRLLHMSCVGDVASQTTTIGENQGGMQVTGERRQMFEGVYSLKYLMLFVKSTALSPNCEMMLREEFPLILRYAVASLGTLSFCLAPRCES